MSEDLRNLTKEEIREKLEILRAKRKTEYTQPQRKKKRTVKNTIEDDTATKILELIETHGSIEAAMEFLTKQEEGLDE